MTKFLNISTDNTLGGSSPSDETVSSQKAVKTYIDAHASGSPSWGSITGTLSNQTDLKNALDAKYDASNPNGYTSNVGTVTSVNNVSPVNGNVTLSIPTVDSALSTTSTNAVQNKVITSALNGKLDGFTLRFAGNWSGGVHAVNFVTIDYSGCDSENGVFIKFSMVNSHGNGQAGRFLQDVVLNVKYTGEVAGTLYRYFAVPIDQSSSEYYGSHSYGDVFWVNDTTNKIVKFYVLMHQYSYTSQSPYFRLNASTKGVITQSSGGAHKEEYSSGTRVWATINWFETDQTYSATSPKPQSGVAIAGAGFLTSITGSMVTTALGYTPYNSTNPSGYQANVIETVKVNGTALTPSSKAVDVSVPTESTVSGWGFTKNAGTVTSVNNVSPVNGNVSLSIPTVNNATLTLTQGGTTKGTFTANASSNVTIDLDSGGSVDVDNKSITTNSSDEIQTVGVINSRDSSTAIKTWTGTKAQYDAITTKDSATLYNITDDQNISLSILELLYPVGSIYITTAEMCPLSSLISGSTWVLVSSGRVLQGADSGHTAGTTIEAGLPNITSGTDWANTTKGTSTDAQNAAPSNDGCFVGNSSGGHGIQSNSYPIYWSRFDASNSNSIYGNSTTVQPPAYVVNIYRRTA